jgi:hypothetical protein
MLARIAPTFLLGAVLAVGAALGGVTGSARGQGTDGSTADPISTADLMRYAERLSLSPQQRTALERLHDEYKAEFRVLRDGEIAAFMDKAGRLGGVMPTRDTMEELVDELDRVQLKIRLLDERMLDRLSPMLTEQQAALLPRIRQHRERARYSTTQLQQMMSLSGRRPIDLGDMWIGMDVPPDVFEAVDPMIAAYERELTVRLRELNESVTRMYLDLFQAIEDAGFAEMNVLEGGEDPEEMQRFGQLMQQVWIDLMKRIGDIAGEITELDRRTLRSVTSLMPPLAARDLETRYYARAFPEVSFALATGENAAFDAMVEVEPLTVEERESIASIVDELHRRLDRIRDQAIEVVEEQRQRFSMFDPGGEDNAELAERLAALREESITVRGQVMTQLAEGLGAERFAEIQAAALKARAGAGSSEPEETGPIAADLSDPRVQDEARWSGDAFVKPRISHADVRRYANRLGLNDGLRDVVASMHADYAARYRELAEIATLKKANAELWRHDPETDTSLPPSEEMIDRILDLRRTAIAAIRAEDDRLFGEIAVIVDETEVGMVERLRRQRERTVYAVSGDTAWLGLASGGSAGAVDLVDLVIDLRLDPEAAGRVDEILDRYEGETMDVLRTRLEAALLLKHHSDLFTASSRRAELEGEGSFDWPAYQGAIGPPSKEFRAATEAYAKLNASYRDELAPLLTPEQTQAFRRSFDRHSYPAVFDDPLAVETQLGAALDLELTTEQREGAVEIMSAYRPEYDAMCQRMIGFTSVNADFANFGAEDWREYQERQRELERLRYDRDELSLRAASRLKSLLTEDQIRLIGGLPEPPETDEWDVFR